MPRCAETARSLAQRLVMTATPKMVMGAHQPARWSAGSIVAAPSPAYAYRAAATGSRRQSSVTTATLSLAMGAAAPARLSQAGSAARAHAARPSVHVCTKMQQATPAKTVHATPGTRGPTAARAWRARQASTRTQRGPQHVQHVLPAPCRLQVGSSSFRSTRWRNHAHVKKKKGKHKRMRLCLCACVNACARVSACISM